MFYISFDSLHSSLQLKCFLFFSLVFLARLEVRGLGVELPDALGELRRGLQAAVPQAAPELLKEK